MNLGVHDFDLAAYLLGARLAVKAATRIEGSIRVTTRTSSNPPCEHAFAEGAARERTLRVRTDDGTRYEADLVAGAAFRVEGLDRTPLVVVRDEPLALQARAFIDAVHGRCCASLALGQDGFDAVALAEAAEKLLDEPAEGHCASP